MCERHTIFLAPHLGHIPTPAQLVSSEVISEETKRQFMDIEGRLPDEMIACVGGGSNAIGFFFDFLDEPNVRLIGVEAGRSLNEGGLVPPALKVASSGCCRVVKLGFCKIQMARSIRPIQFPLDLTMQQLVPNMPITKIWGALNSVNTREMMPLVPFENFPA